MTQQIHRRHVGDTVAALSVCIQRANAAGVMEPVDLTGKTVNFRMVNAATGAEKVAETAATVTTAASGYAKYDFQDADVDTAGIFSSWFIVYTGSESDTFPVLKNGLRVYIDSDTQTAEEAYEASL